jgi:hypothetical protein
MIESLEKTENQEKKKNNLPLIKLKKATIMVAFLDSKFITEKKVFLLTKEYVVRSSPITNLP